MQIYKIFKMILRWRWCGLCCWMLLLLVSTLADNYDLNKQSQCIINEYLILKENESVQDPFVVCGQITCGPGGQVILKRCAIPQLPEHCRAGKLLNTRSLFPECCHRETECSMIAINGSKIWNVLVESSNSDSQKL